MRLRQLQFFIALADRGNFHEAAHFCHISQPALSMAIQNLEAEVGCLLINRQLSPVQLTKQGRLLYSTAKKIIFDWERLKFDIQGGTLAEGCLRIGVIPTVAPYLVPLFIGEFIAAFPQIELQIHEVQTETILSKIKRNEIDAGILVTPLEDLPFLYEPLYYEEFFVYSKESFGKKFLLPQDLDPNKLWLLEEGHCLRNQILHLCELQQQSTRRLSYNAGSIETLIQLVNNYDGVTVIPELAVDRLDAKQRKRINKFQPPVPVREISLVYHKYSVLKNLFKVFVQCIKEQVPDSLKNKKRRRTIEVSSM